MQKRPNILIFMSDDQGPWAMNCAGTPELRTPNLNRLSEEGLRFTNFFCASPVCSPARASFLTGSIPSQHGVHDWIRHGNMIDPEGRTWHGPETRIEYLAGRVGFTDILAEHGYRCSMFGKWHLGASDVPQKSYSHWCVHSLGGSSYTDYWVFDNSDKMTHQTQYVTDYFTDKAISHLDELNQSDQPFCMNVHYTAPHSPWIEDEQPKDIWDSYENIDFSLPIEEAHPWEGWNPSPEKRRKTIQGYYTTITAMDRAIGLILDKLDELGLTQNTLVVFSGDNGFNMGHHGIMGKGNATFPLNMYEESVKVPFIIRHPGQVVKNQVTNEMVSHYDFFPTLLDYLSIKHECTEDLPGRSFSKLLKGEPFDSDDREIVIFEEYGPNRMIRTQRHKYILRYPDGPNELYDLEQDPGEKSNLIHCEESTQVVEKLGQRLDRWFSQYVHPNTDGSKQLDCCGKGQLAKLEGAETTGAFASRS